MEGTINSELQYTLEDILPKFGEDMRRKIRHSVDLLRKSERLALAYDPADGFYLAFSGGKDSQCLYHVARLAGVRFKAHMSLTSVDPAEVIRFVKRQYPDVELIKPRRSIYAAAVERRILPTMRVRWCCAEYKEGAGAGKVTLIGIRHAESSRRARRSEVEISSRKFSGDLEGLEQYRKERNRTRRGRKPAGYKETTIVNADGEVTQGCIRGKETLLISPVIDWTEEDVWTFLDTLGVEHCVLYDQGWTRIGCINCPMASAKQKRLENERWPHVKKNWIKAIKAIRTGGIEQETQGQDTEGTSAVRQPVGGDYRKPEPQIRHQQRLAANSVPIPTRRTSGEGTFKEGYVWWNIPRNLTPCRRVGGKLRKAKHTPPNSRRNASTGDFGRVFRLLHA